MSALTSIYGENGIFLSLGEPSMRRQRLDMMFNIITPASCWLHLVSEKFGPEYAKRCRQRFSLWMDTVAVGELRPDFRKVMQDVITELRTVLPYEALVDHLEFFYGEKAVEKFKTSGFPVQNCRPEMARMFLDYVLVSLRLDPIELEYRILFMYVANEKFVPSKLEPVSV